jgi:hypothetical protein
MSAFALSPFAARICEGKHRAAFPLVRRRRAGRASLVSAVLPAVRHLRAASCDLRRFHFSKQKNSASYWNGTFSTPLTKHLDGPQDCAWEARFAKLRAHADVNGHVNLNRRNPEQAPLYRWIIMQRHEWNSGKLSPERYRLLSSIPGFVWDKQYELWKRNFVDLVAYKEKTGSCTVAFRECSPESRQLARWAVKQRYMFKRGLLYDDRRRRLEGIGFQFCPEEDRFQARLIQFQQFNEKRGFANVPDSWTADPSLARWVDSVRSRWRKGKLSLRHFRALTSVRFCFLPLETSWESHFFSLSSYARRYGHARPSFLEDRVLNQWLAAQRKCFASGSLCVDKYQQLADLGVDFRPWRIIFAEGLEELRRFREHHGHLNVLSNTKLASWIAQVRSSGPKSISRAGLIELESLGFSWTRRAST